MTTLTQFFSCDDELQKQKKNKVKKSLPVRIVHSIDVIIAIKLCVRCLHEWTSHKLYFDVSHSL